MGVSRAGCCLTGETSAGSRVTLSVSDPLSGSHGGYVCSWYKRVWKFWKWRRNCTLRSQRRLGRRQLYLTVNADEKGQTDSEQGAQFCCITALLTLASSSELLISVKPGVYLGTWMFVDPRARKILHKVGPQDTLNSGLILNLSIVSDHWVPTFLHKI